ncbi:MAG TPA: ornithine--oxo-acid transaminase [Fimbriimonadaceae bacterium]|nr:ornithine--oxo-acid transaminase [Fimbriimonadaceae bacterium]
MERVATDVWAQIAEKGVLSLVEAISDAESIDLANEYGTHNYAPMPVNIVRGEGARVWDGSGKEYIDCVGAYSAVAHGHLNPAIVRTIESQLKKVALTSRAYYTSELGLFMKLLAQYCELDVVCPMNTGTEAVETCIKLARKWGYDKKKVEDGRAEIIVCEDNFHGRTTTIVGFSSEQTYREGFGPFTPGFRMVPFGDIDALRAAITPNTVAFLAEPIQAEGGILVPPDGWLREVRDLCTKENVLLVWDEVQTGFCRTGKKFAWMEEGAKPDLVAVGKPLGGGVLPVSAAVGRREVMDVFTPGTHGSTFGGNPLAAVTALAALAEMETKDYAGNSARLGETLKAALKAIKCSAVIDVRGRGLLVGMEVDASVDSKALQKAFIENGVLTKETRSRTFRFAPPLIADAPLIEEIVVRTKAALGSVC